MSGIIVALIGICGTILGTLIGGISTHLLHYKNRKSEETKIINESIHYLLEVFFLVNRLNFEKMIDAYVDYYLQEIRKIFPKMDDDSIESIKKQFYPQLKNTIVPLSQKYSFEKLKELENDYKSMLDKLSIVLPVDAYYLRGKNDVKSLLNLLSDYLKEVEFTGIEKEDVLRNLIGNMQSSLTTKAIDEYADGIKKELTVLLSKTDRYNRKIGKKTIDDIVSTMLTEDEKREINTLIGSVLEQIKKDAAKTTVS